MLYRTTKYTQKSVPIFSLFFLTLSGYQGFPGGSDSKESTCSVGDLGSLLGLGRTPGGGHGNPLQYSVIHKESDTTKWLSTCLGTSSLTSSLIYQLIFLTAWLVGALVSWAETEPGPWQWKPQVLTTGPPLNSLSITYCWNRPSMYMLQKSKDTKALTEWKLCPSHALSPIFQFLSQEIYQFLLSVIL